MKKNNPHGLSWQPRIMRMLIFPASVLAIYGILFIFMPDKILLALGKSGSIFISIIAPLSMVFLLMLALNLLLKPAQIVRFLGKGAGIKGLVLSATAGIISVGPIYAWYPLLKDLREKGAENSNLAIFLGNRAVKPFLLPIMISYFGWIYVLILTIFTILASIIAGYSIGVLIKQKISF